MNADIEKQKVKEITDRLEQELVTAEELSASASTVIADFRAKTNELFHEISEMSASEVEETVKCHVQAKLDEFDIDARIVDAVLVGSRCRGLEGKNSDIDVVVELKTEEREDDLFNMFNEDGLTIGGIKVDINPITTQRTGILETYLPIVEKYLEGVREARERETSGHNVQKSDSEVTFTVAECGEFPNLGVIYQNLKTVDEAVTAWDKVNPDPTNRVPGISIHVHVPGTEEYEDGVLDVLSAGRFDLEFLDRVPEVCDNPKAIDMIAELIAKMPQVEVLGELDEKIATKVQGIRDAAQIECKLPAKVSLKARLAEKKAEIAGNVKAQIQDKEKSEQRKLSGELRKTEL